MYTNWELVSLSLTSPFSTLHASCSLATARRCLTGPPNGPVLFCWLATVIMCNADSVRAGRPPGAWESGGRHCTAGQYGYVPLGRHIVIRTSQRQTNIMNDVSACCSVIQSNGVAIRLAACRRDIMVPNYNSTEPYTMANGSLTTLRHLTGSECRGGKICASGGYWLVVDINHTTDTFPVLSSPIAETTETNTTSSHKC